MEYGIKVVEIHTDVVWVEADNEDEAREKAIESAKCEYSCLYQTKIIAREAKDQSEPLPFD